MASGLSLPREMPTMEMTNCEKQGNRVLQEPFNPQLRPGVSETHFSGD
jgi:hypothetical protein